MTAHNQHVVPHEGKWAIRTEGSEKLSSVHDTQEEAITRARERAHRLDTTLFIHDAHGRFKQVENIHAGQVAAKEANADQHVVPYEEQWAVMAAGSDKPSSAHDTQHDAIEKAREAAKKQNTVLFIHGRDGHVRELHSYGK